MSKPPVTPPAFKPAQWEIPDAAAIQALHRGDATPEQQRLALQWIIDAACGTYDLSFRPGGDDGDRETCFAEGRRFVGSQIVKLLKINLNTLRKAHNG